MLTLLHTIIFNIHNADIVIESLENTIVTRILIFFMSN